MEGYQKRAGGAPLVARRHVESVRAQHQRDLEAGYGHVVLPEALHRKYPNAATEWLWQLVFPAGRICKDPKCGSPSCFYLHESAIQRAVTVAARAAGVTKRVSCHTFRHSFGTHLLESGRHPHGPGSARPLRRAHDDDLHARAESRRPSVQSPLDKL